MRTRPRADDLLSVYSQNLDKINRCSTPSIPVQFDQDLQDAALVSCPVLSCGCDAAVQCSDVTKR